MSRETRFNDCLTWILATGIDQSKAPRPNKTFAVHSRPLHWEEKIQTVYQNPGRDTEKRIEQEYIGHESKTTYLLHPRLTWAFSQMMSLGSGAIVTTNTSGL
jgi:hypothetical protein